MENKEWLKELMEENKRESMGQPDLTELEQMLEAAIAKKKQEPQTDWDRIQAAKKHNEENNKTFQNVPGKFNQQSYDENDKKAKDLMIKFLTTKGHVITQSEETFGTDIITNKGKYEVEMSSKDFTTMRICEPVKSADMCWSRRQPLPDPFQALVNFLKKPNL